MRSGVVYLLLSLYILCVGPPALAIAVLFRRPALPVVLGLFVVRLARAILGIRFRVRGLEHVAGSRPAVYCLNHTSNVDVLVFEILYRRCNRLKGLYKAELGRIPILGRVLKVVEFVPLERGHREQTVKAVEQATRMLRNGDSFLIAPEGTRSTTGQLLPFRKGAFLMAIGAGVPIIPIVIKGGPRAMPKGSAIVRSTVLDVSVGSPIETTGMTVDDRDRLIALVRARMETMLAAG